MSASIKNKKTKNANNIKNKFSKILKKGIKDLKQKEDLIELMSDTMLFDLAISGKGSKDINTWDFIYYLKNEILKESLDDITIKESFIIDLLYIKDNYSYKTLMKNILKIIMEFPSNKEVILKNSKKIGESNKKTYHYIKISNHYVVFSITSSSKICFIRAVPKKEILEDIDDIFNAVLNLMGYK